MAPVRPTGLASTDPESDAEYTPLAIAAPIFSGFRLKLFAWLLESYVLGPLLHRYLKKKNMITKFFVETPYTEPPMHMPRFPTTASEEPLTIQLNPKLSPIERLSECLNTLPAPSAYDAEGFRHWTIRDYHSAYISGKTTPSKVAKQLVGAVKDSLQPSPGMGFFISCDEEDILKQAESSTARYRKGEPLSMLDGVPIAVKDEIDCLPYPTSGGSTWLPHIREVKEDAACIKRLRECGALLVGKTNMHELGAGITCINPHYGAARNPYDKSRFSGGSSGGSAAAVAAGLCPAALGVDGGGSVRIPSALCGIVGLKGTFGRISSAGVLPLNWTLGAVGVHAATVEDALIMYIATHGSLPTDFSVSKPPLTNIPILNEMQGIQNSLGDIRFAKFTKWFEDCDDPISGLCFDALKKLQQHYECKIVEVTLPELEQMKRAHYITIASEFNTSMGTDYFKWGRSVSGMDTRCGAAMYTTFDNREYLTAQRVRYRQMHYHMDIFRKADIIVTPATGCTAKHVSKKATEVGELDYVLGGKIMQYQIGANLLGFPAITVPVGYDDQGMPIGIQFLGSPWSEATLLRVAFAMERLMASNMREPEVYYNLLPDVPYAKETSNTNTA